MNYLETIVYLESLSPTTQKPCLERVDAFLAENKRPQERFQALHVGGTNGKGSTVAMLDSVLRRAGLKVGRFTGPHLLHWNERFHIDGQAISDQEFAELATRLRRLSEEFGRRHPEFGPLTWFEFLTAIAFFYFAENQVDLAVVEVGLGGRWDATNVLASPAAAAITNVDLDHTQILGETVLEIAREKAGIIKAGKPVVTAATGEALAEIARQADTLNAELVCCLPPDMISLRETAAPARSGPASRQTELLGFAEAREHLALAGSHQQVNALVAAGILSVSALTERFAADPREAMRAGLSSVYWPGRLQYLPGLKLILDGAHNPAGARALRRALDELFPGKAVVFVLGCFQNKDAPGLVAALLNDGDCVVACEAAARRQVYSAEAIAEIARTRGLDGRVEPSVGQALLAALDGRHGGEIVVATGSFATVRESMLALGWSCVEDGLSISRMNWGSVPTRV